MIKTSIAFAERMKQAELGSERSQLKTLQVNVGKLCNQACHHCHVEAGPRRTEIMESRTAERIQSLMKASKGIKTLDITGGAPELNENFKSLVSVGRELGLEVIDRCNFTVLFEAGLEELPRFLADNSVRVIASLPCYTQENVEKQRGSGVFQKSIDAMRTLNGLGYGAANSGLILDLVYNPLGAYLPGSQTELQHDYKEHLKNEFNVTFNSLLTITNMPIKRFLHQLQRDGELEAYMQLLIDNFNPQAAANIMCRELISVGWNGLLYDCDFNQMLDIQVRSKRTIWDIESFDQLASERIAFANHCYGCTAGAGSSCTGSLSNS